MQREQTSNHGLQAGLAGLQQPLVPITATFQTAPHRSSDRHISHLTVAWRVQQQHRPLVTGKHVGKWAASMLGWSRRAVRFTPCCLIAHGLRLMFDGGYAQDVPPEMSSLHRPACSSVFMMSSPVHGQRVHRHQLSGHIGDAQHAAADGQVEPARAARRGTGGM